MLLYYCILDGPDPNVRLTENVTVSLDDPMLTCVMSNSNPAPDYKWVKDQTPLAEGPVLALKSSEHYVR